MERDERAMMDDGPRVCLCVRTCVYVYVCVRVCDGTYLLINEMNCAQLRT